MALLPSSCHCRAKSLARLAAPRRSVAARRAPLRVQALFGKDGPQGGMGNLMENMKKAQAMVTTEAAKVQEELSQQTFDGYDEEETVQVTFLGNQTPHSVQLTEDAMKCDQAELESRVKEAMLDAHSKSVEGMRTKMSEMAGKLGLPDNMKLPGM